MSGDVISLSSVDRRRGVQTFQKILTYLPSYHFSTYFHISTSPLHNLYNPFKHLTFLPSHFHFLALKNHHYPGILSYCQLFSITLNIVPPGLSSLQSIGTRVMVRRHSTHHCPVSQCDMFMFCRDRGKYQQSADIESRRGDLSPKKKGANNA